MKKLYFLLIAVALVSVMTSCKSSSSSKTTARCVEPKVTELYADLDVKTTKTIGECTWEGKKKEDPCIEELMRIAVYNALQSHKADVLVAPQYRIKEEVRGHKSIKITVTGYPATYVNFRHTATIDELEVQQLDPSKPYLLKAKTSAGQIVGYQVIVPVDKDVHTIDLEQTTLDKIVLNCAEQPKPVPTTSEPIIYNKDGQVNPPAVIVGDGDSHHSHKKCKKHHCKH